MALAKDRRYALAIGCYALQDTTYGYDAFGRMTTSDGPGVTDQGTVSYDGLDRRDTKAEAGETLDYAYVGLSEKLSREQTATGNVKQYEYDSALRRLGQRTSQSGVGLGYRSFAYDANGSVEGLEGTDGEVLATDRYRYDPYGELQDAETGLSPAARANPFRFEGFYYDAAVRTYDMQARPYRPDIGRFLVQDRFESASGDFALQSDPMMSNRYTFASANPVNNIEFDGHKAPTGGRDSTSKSFSVYGGKTIRNRSYSAETVFPQSRPYLQHGASGDAGLPDAIGGYRQARAVPPPKDNVMGSRCVAVASAGGCAAWGETGYASSSGGGPSLGSVIHFGLDVAGGVPALGEPFDLVNCGFYAAEGEQVDAGLSCAAAIPLAGWVATGAKAGKRATTAAKAPALGSENAYSVGFRAHLGRSSYPGKSRASHFREANRDLLRALDEDPVWAGRMETMIPGLRDQLANAGGTVARKPPTGWTWHHAADEGAMELVPSIQHTAPGRLQQLLHPSGRGGYSRWGRR